MFLGRKYWVLLEMLLRPIWMLRIWRTRFFPFLYHGVIKIGEFGFSFSIWIHITWWLPTTAQRSVRDRRGKMEDLIARGEQHGPFGRAKRFRFYLEILESLPNGKKSKTVSVHKQLKRFSLFLPTHGKWPGSGFAWFCFYFSCILAIVYFLGNSFLVQEA